MPVADTLDQAARQRWDALARPGEEILLAAASDVAADGSYGARWLVITNQRVVVLPDGDVAPENGKAAALAGAAPAVPDGAAHVDGYVALPLGDLTEAKTEPVVGGGRLEVYHGNVPVPLVEYSSSLGPKFAEVARGLQLLIKGQPLRVSDDLPPLRCPKCGRRLPDKHATCSRCVRKAATLLRLAPYLKPVWPLALTSPWPPPAGRSYSSRRPTSRS